MPRLARQPAHRRKQPALSGCTKARIQPPGKPPTVIGSSDAMAFSGICGREYDDDITIIELTLSGPSGQEQQ